MEEPRPPASTEKTKDPRGDVATVMAGTVTMPTNSTPMVATPAAMLSTNAAAMEATISGTHDPDAGLFLV